MAQEMKKRALWTQDQLTSAMLAVQTGSSQRDAAERFGIPRRTLRNHIKSGKTSKNLGRPSILTDVQEREFSNRIVRLCEVGLPLTPSLVRRQAYKFCENNNIRHPFNVVKELAGKDWLARFLKRNPNLSKRKAQHMNPARAQKLNKFIVNDYFGKIREVFEELDIHANPQNLFNMDEKGCRLTIHHQQQVIAQKGSKRVHLVAPEHAENVTIAGCCNALGNAIPPMIIFKGKRLKPEWADELPLGSLVRMAPKGSMTTELFIEFLRHLSRYKGSGPTLLVFDGASSHLDYSIVDEADRLQIRLFCLPSNTTHELQPLDKAVYRSFEYHWDQELLRFWDRHPERRLSKARFSTIFSKVWTKCMTPNNILSGFAATGMFPLDPSAIPETAYAPSLATERPLEPIVRNAADIELPTDRSSEFVIANRDATESPTERHVEPVVENSGDIDSSSSESDDIPLSAIASKLARSKNEDRIINEKEISFKELLPSPALPSIKEKKCPRRKSINYRAQQVTKDLFAKSSCSFSKHSKPEETASTSKAIASTSKAVIKHHEEKIAEESWYCKLCNTDEKLDMRLCSACKTWYHEQCMGLTADDSENFVCPDCE